MSISYIGGRRDGELQIQLYPNDEDSRPPGRPNNNNQGRVEKEDDLMVCPYDSRHLIRPERFAHHLNKCMKKHRRRHEFVVCDGNFQHHVLRTQIAAHNENCQDMKELREWRERNGIDQGFWRMGAVDIATMNFGQANPGIHPQINQEVTTDENWDIFDQMVFDVSDDEASDENSA